MPGITTGVSAITKCFPEAGGASTYDVSPPAATTEATAAGVALSAHTFGAFTGADAGLIDGYTARTVNAVGSTSWSGTGLGAYTPSGGADGDAGVLALDATIGGVVVATALHDYSRAAAAGGGGKSWSNAASVSYTASSTGALSSGTAVIGGVTHDVTIPASCTATDDANGIRVSKTGGGFFYIGVDAVGEVTDIEAPYRIAFALDNITTASGGNVGAAVYSAATPDAAVRAPSVQDRISRSGSDYNEQPLHTSGAIGGSSSFGNAGNRNLGGAVSSCVIEMYVWNGMAAVKLTTGTTTIPAATDPADVFSDTSYRIMSLATGGAASGSNPSFWPQGWGSVVIGSGSAVAIDADIVTLSIDEWG